MSTNIVVFAVLLLIYPCIVSATSNRLKTVTITSCNGRYYGQHGSDNHWHEAKKINDYWYAVGQEL